MSEERVSDETYECSQGMFENDNSNVQHVALEDFLEEQYNFKMSRENEKRRRKMNGRHKKNKSQVRKNSH